MQSPPKDPDFVDIMLELARLSGNEGLVDENGQLKYDPMVYKTERLYLRIPKYDKDNLTKLAQSMGMPYQTLATAVLRYYIQAQLKKK